MAMLRIRRKFALILCGICLFLFLFIYILINHSISNEKTKIVETIEKQLSKSDTHRVEEGDVRSELIETIEEKWVDQLNANQDTLDRIASPENEDDSFIPSSCNFRADLESQADIQMLDVYNEIEFKNIEGGVWKQGWNLEYDPMKWNNRQKLKVFVVPHSHNDPGWIKTFDEYYNQQTKLILTNMLHQLTENPDMTFIWAEISYFSKWYEELNTKQHQEVKNLIRRRQLEFVTGGWVMPDEANSHWVNILQQLTEGHTWLKVNLNVTPVSSWSIDPFGQSATMPFILKEAGIENLLIQRTHYEVKKYLAKKKDLEFRWRQLWDNEGSTDLFTHMMPFYSYDVPHTCGPDPKVCCQFDFKRLPGYGLTCPWRIPPQLITELNVAKKAELILDQWRKKSSLYKTGSVLIPLGDDFRYSQNTEWEAQRENYEKIFDYINNEPSLNAEAKFGTLNEYFDSIHSEQELNNFSTLSGDFFTYADRDDHYWSGYYTSRPFHKRMDRVLMRYLRSAEMLYSWSTWSADANFSTKLQSARRALSLFQHHDGITGTARDHVVKDYERQMISALKDCKFVIQQAAYRFLTRANVYQPDYTYTYFNLDDSRSAGGEENRPTIILGEDVPVKYIVLHNSLPRYREEVVEFIVSKPLIIVEDQSGQPLRAQVTPVWSWHKGGLAGLTPQSSSTKFKLLFKPKVPPLGLKTYIIRSVNSIEQCKSTNFSVVQILTQFPFTVNLPEYPVQVEFSDPQDVHLRASNQHIVASFNKFGLLKSMTAVDEQVPVNLDFLHYGARRGAERSGAYLFLPDGDAVPFKKVASNTVLVTRGQFESSVTTGFPFAIHENILRENENALEIRNLIDIGDLSNTEIVMRISTSIENDDTFYTDLNGFELMKRQRFSKLPTQANYYPIPSAIYIEDDKLRLTLLTAQPLGGSSLKGGDIEIMQDRRLDQDDNRGLGQGVTDNKPVYNIFKLSLENIQVCRKRFNSYRAGYFTPNTHNELNHLLYPMEKLVWHENEWSGVIDSFGEGRTPLGNGIEVSLLKTLPKIDARYKEAVGLVINRSYLEQCDEEEKSTGESVNIQRILNIDSKRELFASKITLLERKLSLKSWSVNICPMQIKGYIINR